MTDPATGATTGGMSGGPPSEVEVLYVANFATPRRTALGALVHLSGLGLPAHEQRAFLSASGIPPIAVEEPDIPIAYEQQLACFERLLARLEAEGVCPLRYATEVGSGAAATFFGVLGLAAIHAPSLPEVARVFCDYPELSWGTCRCTATLEGSLSTQTFVVDLPPAFRDNEALRRYALTVELFATVRINADVVGPQHRPRALWLPYPAPSDPTPIRQRVGCDVRFDAPEARILYDASALAAVPPAANVLAFRAFERLASEVASRLRVDLDLQEQVKRLLHSRSPPPDRDTVAFMLALSPRSLSRKLAAEGTSYAELHREVRSRHARRYLRNRTLRLSEIAGMLGFGDATAFSRAFRRWEGVTPSVWRAREVGRPEGARRFDRGARRSDRG